MRKFFSNADSSFYLEDTIQVYEAQGIFVPLDLREISDLEYESFMVSPDRKTPHYNIDRNCMEWIDIAPPSQEECISIARSTKERLLSIATQAISPLQDAVDLSMATEAEIVSLQQWKRYRVIVNRIDANDAPDIIWPETPPNS
ncbi:tail fiber assembly protein [Enterobacter kobei]|uniref:tail fiber assembly protein n=1 Tax=Enterobacter kobei TaxID=208224 RepID=UPI001F51F249|nr:tail fiber assembly protein [Enterobacter kobei]EMC7916462.1 tail fiber assembly protein [Enterobacter kobei]MCH4288982.1 tail fiber assembly protein [Enterobacter kobei]